MSKIYNSTGYHPKSYCKIHGIACEYSNVYGYCNMSVCVKSEVYNPPKHQSNDRFCGECNARIDGWFKHCPGCGKRLE